MARDCRDRALKGLGMLAPFSPILNQLLAELASENSSLARLAGLIEKDAVLAGEVLGRANSCLYQRGSPVNSARHAVALLGIERVRNVALSFSVARLCTRQPLPPGFSKSAFNLHSSAVALMAGLLEQRLMPGCAESAFSAGLLHDISRLLVAVVLPEEFRIIAQNGLWEQEREAEVLGVTHSELSANVIERWKLPSDVQEAVAMHHCRSAEMSTIALADLVSAADRFADPVEAPDALNNLASSESALAGLGVDDEIPGLVAEFHSAFKDEGVVYQAAR